MHREIFVIDVGVQFQICFCKNTFALHVSFHNVDRCFIQHHRSDSAADLKRVDQLFRIIDFGIAKCAGDGWTLQHYSRSLLDLIQIVNIE